MNMRHLSSYSTLGQNFVWVGQARVWVGHGLPGLIARTATAVTASAPSVEGTGVYRQYLPLRADSSDFGLACAKFPKMGDFLTPINLPLKFDATSFILAGEIRHRTNKQTKNERTKTVNDIPIPSCCSVFRWEPI